MRDVHDMRDWAEHGPAFTASAGRGLEAALGLVRRRVRRRPPAPQPARIAR